MLKVGWNQNGNWLLTAARDQLLKLFDVRTMRELQTFKAHKKEVTCIISTFLVISTHSQLQLLHGIHFTRACLSVAVSMVSFSFGMSGMSLMSHRLHSNIHCLYSFIHCLHSFIHCLHLFTSFNCSLCSIIIVFRSSLSFHSYCSNLFIALIYSLFLH